jgi:chromosomal replication initiator protein
MQNLWDACLRRLEQELPAQQFNTWIRPLAPETGAPNDTLILAAPNRFVLELVRERFAARIERLVAEASGRELGLRLVLARAADAPVRTAQTTARAPVAFRSTASSPGKPTSSRARRRSRWLKTPAFRTTRCSSMAA